MNTSIRNYTAEQHEFLQLLRDAVEAAKDLRAAMSEISMQLVEDELQAA